MLSALGVRHMHSQAPSKSHSAQDWGWGSLEKVGMMLQWTPESRGSEPEQGEPCVGHRTLGGDFNQQRM